MNDIFKETFGASDTSKQTPIEIALGVDAQGMTTASFCSVMSYMLIP